jgi:hypothetical protein
LTSQGSAHGRFTRAVQQRNLWAAETSLRELGQPSLEDALAYLDLLAEQKPEKLERAAVRWHGRLEWQAPLMTLAESQLALAALSSLAAGERDAVEVLRGLLRRVRPTAVPQVSQSLRYRRISPLRAWIGVVLMDGPMSVALRTPSARRVAIPCNHAHFARGSQLSTRLWTTNREARNCGWHPGSF